MTETARLVIAVDSTQVSRAEADLTKFSSTSSVVERNVSSLGSTVKTVAAAFGAFKVGEQVADIVSLASRYDQLGVVMQTVGGNVGRSRVELEALDQTLRETGISALQSRNNIIKMMSANIDLSKATELARLAQNAAVVANINSSEAFERLIRGIQSAEKETLETMGLNVNFSQSYERLAAQLGKNADQLSTTEKVQAGVNAALEAGKNIAGAYSASLDNAGKQLQSSSRYLEDFKVALGGALQTEFSGAVAGYSNSLKFLSENVETVSEVMRVGLYAAAGRASAAIFEATRASVASAVASRAQAAEELKLAQAQAASTAAALAQARANVGLVGSIGSVTAATAAHEAAQKRLAVAQAATMGVGRSMLGLMGGPVGLIATVGLTALSFVEFGDKAKGGMDKAANATEQAAMRIRNATRNLLPGDIGTLSYDALQEQVAKVESQLASARGELERLQAGFDAGNISEQWLDKPREKVAALEGALSKLKGEMDGVRFASDTAGESYSKNLERQAVLVGKVTEEQRLRAMVEAGYIKLSEKDLALAIERAKRIDAVTASLKGSTSGVNEQANAYQALYDRLYPAEAAQRRYTEEVDRLKTVLKGNELADAIARLNAEMLEPGADATGPADAIEEYRKELQRLEDQLDPVGKATSQYQKDVERLNDAMERGERSPERTAELLAELERQYKDNTKATSEWAKWTEGALDRVDGAFADAWRNIGDGFSSFRDSLTNAFKQMLAELAHMAITRPIVLQIGAALGIGGAAGQATAMMGGGSGGGIGVGSLLQYGQTAYSAITGVGPAALAGWQSGGLMGGIQGVGGYYGGALSGINAGAGQVIGTLLNGGGMTYAPLSYQLSSGALNGAIGGLAGIGGALYGYSQAGLKGAATGGLGAWGGATLGNILLPGIGGIIGGALGSALGGSLFGGDWETKDVGLAFSVENGDFLGQQYKYQKKKGGLFSSNKKRTRFSALDDETAARFQSAFDATEDTVAGLFEALSLSVEEGSLDGLQLARTKISTKGKTEEEIQQAIAEWFGSAADAMTAELNKVFATGLDYDLAGMQAFVGNLQGVNEVLRYLDVGMYDASVSGGKLAEALSAAAGGLDALAANSANYYGAFFSEAEKIEDTIDSIKRAFESADVELAASREAYRAMVEDIDLTTEAGQKMFATMMALSGQAAQYFSIVEQQAAAAAAQAAAAAAQALANTQLYYEQFTTAAQKADDVLAAVTAQFSALEVELPATRAGFIATVDALDRSTEAGQRMFSVLMGAAGAADAYYDILEARAASVSAGTANAAVAASRGALSTLSAAINAEKSSIASAYQAQADSIRSAIGSANDSLSQMRSVASTLRSAVNGLRLESEQFAAQSRRSAQQTIRQALSSGGRVQMTAQLERALDTVSDSSEDLFGSFEDYARDYWQTYFAIEQLAERAEDQLSADEQAVKALERQLDQSQRFHDAEIERLDGVLEGANAQLEALLGIDTSVQSVETALAAFTAALAAAQQLQNANSSITSVTGLGGVKRQVTSEGYILDELGNQMELFGEAMRVVGNKVVGGMGATLNIGADGQLSWATGDYERWAKQEGIPGFASGGLHSGGLRLVGENGPELEVTGPSRIYNASQTAAMLGGGSETASEVRALRSDFAGMMDALRSVAKHTMQTAKRVEFLERWDFDGLPKERATA